MVELNLKNRFINFYNFITKDKVVRICIVLFFIVFIPSLIIGVIIANVLDPAGDGYDIIRNYISDLGSYRYTPIPKFLDDSAMFSSIILIPVIIYLKKMYDVTEDDKANKISYYLKAILNNAAFICGLSAMVGFFGIGFFSEDVSDALSQFDIEILGLSTHMFFSYLVFGSLCFTGVFMGFYMLLFSDSLNRKTNVEIPKIFYFILGIEMIIWPTFHGISYLIDLPPSKSFHEWFMLFAIFSWVLPIFIIIYVHASRNIIKNNKIFKN
ncbi:MAG: hypothetical protein ACTSRP_16465 [Candidatus Helarchaeota archaeon]